MSSDFWNGRYAGENFLYGTEPNDWLRSQSHHIAHAGSVLCLAEGEGRNAVFLAGLGHAVTAVDSSSVGLQKMQHLASQRGVSVQSVVSDLGQFAIEPASWDAVVSIWCHVPVELRVPLHRAVVRGLKPGGVLILESYHPRQVSFKTGGPSDPTLMMTLAQLTDELKGLEPVLARETEREVHEGQGHFGLSAVTQWLGRKTATKTP